MLPSPFILTLKDTASFEFSDVLSTCAFISKFPTKMVSSGKGLTFIFISFEVIILFFEAFLKMRSFAMMYQAMQHLLSLDL